MSDTRNEAEVGSQSGPSAPLTRSPAAGGWDPLGALRHQIDRLFDDLDGWTNWPLAARLRPDFEPFGGWTSSGALLPAIDLAERDGAYELRAELPGLAATDVEVSVGDGVIIIKGEKSTEREQKDESFHVRERSHGRFQRSLRLPVGIDADKVEARFDKGVLTVMLPKSGDAGETRRNIEVKTA